MYKMVQMVWLNKFMPLQYALWRFWPRTYTLGPYGPGPLIIGKNFLGQICSRTIFEMHTVPGACLLYAPGTVKLSKYGPGAYLT